jgi:sugar transferase (PEP-CTERM/EpsH1 system associated)
MQTPAATHAPPRRLLFLNHSMRMGGIETMIRDFVFGLNGRGFEPSVAVFSGGGPLVEQLSASHFAVADLHKREGIDLRLVLRLRKLLRSRRIDIVHSHNYSAWLYAVLASRGLGVRVVHTEHSRVQPLARRHALERWLGRRTDAVVGVSADVAHSLVHDVGIDAHRVRFIPNGIDLQRYRPQPDLRTALRRSIGAGDEAVVFGIVARLVPVKSHRTLIDAFRRVLGACPAARLLIAGDGPCRGELELQAQQAGLGPAVTFAGEVRDTERMLNGMDVYMLSSTDEGMNLTLLEAMATALPVVATAVGGNPEVVADKLSGLLVPPLDPQAMAEAMLALARDPQRRAALGAQGRRRVEDGFSQERTLQAYAALYEGRLGVVPALAAA